MVLPCNSTASVDGRWPVQVRTIVSAASEAVPVADRFAPPGWAEFEQPLPAAPLLAHGQGVPVPSPKHIEVNPVSLQLARRSHTPDDPTDPISVGPMSAVARLLKSKGGDAMPATQAR